MDEKQAESLFDEFEIEFGRLEKMKNENWRISLWETETNSLDDILSKMNLIGCTNIQLSGWQDNFDGKQDSKKHGLIWFRLGREKINE